MLAPVKETHFYSSLTNNPIMNFCFILAYKPIKMMIWLFSLSFVNYFLMLNYPCISDVWCIILLESTLIFNLLMFAVLFINKICQ